MAQENFFLKCFSCFFDNHIGNYEIERKSKSFETCQKSKVIREQVKKEAPYIHELCNETENQFIHDSQSLQVERKTYNQNYLKIHTLLDIFLSCFKKSSHIDLNKNKVPSNSCKIPVFNESSIMETMKEGTNYGTYPLKSFIDPKINSNLEINPGNFHQNPGNFHQNSGNFHQNPDNFHQNRGIHSGYAFNDSQLYFLSPQSKQKYVHDKLDKKYTISSTRSNSNPHNLETIAKQPLVSSFFSQRKNSRLEETSLNRKVRYQKYKKHRSIVLMSKEGLKHYSKRTLTPLKNCTWDNEKISRYLDVPASFSPSIPKTTPNLSSNSELDNISNDYTTSSETLQKSQSDNQSSCHDSAYPSTSNRSNESDCEYVIYTVPPPTPELSDKKFKIMESSRRYISNESLIDEREINSIDEYSLETPATPNNSNCTEILENSEDACSSVNVLEKMSNFPTKSYPTYLDFHPYSRDPNHANSMDKNFDSLLGTSLSKISSTSQSGTNLQITAGNDCKRLPNEKLIAEYYNPFTHSTSCMSQNICQNFYSQQPKDIKSICENVNPLRNIKKNIMNSPLRKKVTTSRNMPSYKNYELQKKYHEWVTNQINKMPRTASINIKKSKQSKYRPESIHKFGISQNDLPPHYFNINRLRQSFLSLNSKDTFFKCYDGIL